MNPYITSNIHDTFSKALDNGSYISSEDSLNSFKITPKKNIRLHEIFRKAQEYLTRSFNLENLTPEELSSKALLDRKISNLNMIQADGRRLFEHYTKKTNTWWRKIVKSINDYVPRILRSWFPSLFSERMKLSEAATKEQYLKYTAKIESIQSRLRSLIQQIENTQRRDIQPNLTSQTRLPLSASPLVVIDPHKDKSLIDYYRTIFGNNLTDQEVIDLLKNTEYEWLKNLPEDNKRNPITNIDSNAQTILSNTTLAGKAKEKLKQKLFDQIKKNITILDYSIHETLPILQFVKILSCILRDTLTLQEKLATPIADIKNLTIDSNILKTFNNPDFVEALSTKNFKSIEKMLKGTSWEKGFEKSFQGIVRAEMVSRRLIGTPISFKIDNGSVKTEHYLDHFSGIITTSYNCVSSLLSSFQGALLKFQKTCKPCALEINFEDSSLTAEMIRLLLSISPNFPSIILNNIKTISLKDLSVEEQKNFITILPKLDCPKLDAIELDDNLELTLTPQEWGELLNLSPHQTLLQKAFTRSPAFSEIPLPTDLLCLNAWIFNGYSLEQIQYLLERIACTKFVQFTNIAITENQLKQWIEVGFLDDIKFIEISALNTFTTDIFHSLAKLSYLNKLILPTPLSKGKKDLSLLPKFEDPQKISLFYLQSPLTRPYAIKLYEGPTAWASLIQIPLTKFGEKNIFREQDLILDSWSTSLWLYKDNYLSLTPQPNIKSIIADNSDLITDDNIVTFIQKFPEVTQLSLSNCPNLTNLGVSKILNILHTTKITSIDLTDCTNIDNTLFNALNMAAINHLTSLDVSGTKVQLDKKHRVISYTERHLKISNEQLLDPNFLETYLNSKNLSTLASLDFEGCTNLTNDALSLVLARLNTDLEFFNKDKRALEPNPKRLNITLLNLSGCSQITDEAFKESESNGKVNLKILNYLQHIIINGTCISLTLQACYEKVSFHMDPLTHSATLDPKSILNQFISLWELFNSKDQLFENLSIPIRQKASKLIQYYIFLKLFPTDYDDNQESYTKINQLQFNINREKTYPDLNLSFSKGSRAPIFNFSIHSDILYAQSTNYRNLLRPGGKMYGLSGITFENQHATEIASKGLLDLIYGKEIYHTLSWSEAADIAELANKYNFYLTESIYHKLLKRIYSQFNVKQADKILLRLERLKDQVGKKEFETFLIAQLDADPTKANMMRNIATETSHALETLFKKSDDILKQTSEATAINLQKKLDEERRREQIERDAELARRLSTSNTIPNSISDDELFSNLD